MKGVRKTGLGADIFFAPPPAEIKRGVEKKLKAEGSVSNPLEESKPETTPLILPAPTIRIAPPAFEKFVKLTVMIPQDQYDRLEDLKQKERRRLRRAAGPFPRNWRQKVTVTRFVDEAIDDFLKKMDLRRHEE